MNLPQIRQGRMLLKGAQFPLLQPLVEPASSKTFEKRGHDKGIIHIAHMIKAIVIFHEEFG
jgi:hypothetical protein